MNKEFEAVRIEELLALDGKYLDALPFGVIGFAPDAIVTVYNETEARSAGLRAERVLGKHLFEERLRPV
ncbi:PAS domain-containing protein [Burkholderia sp. M6-3]